MPSSGRPTPPPPPPPGAPLHERLERFVRDYTKGMTEAELRRVFDRDATQVFQVLTREHTAEPAPAKGLKRLVWSVRVLFLSISAKLSPGRRAVFAVGIAAFLFAFWDIDLDYNTPEWGFRFDASPLFFTVSIASFLYLFMAELVDRLLVRDELEVARQLQRDLLPKADPELPGWRFATAWRTAREVGGDWYGFEREPDGALRIAVADASGHGMAAGLLAAIANATLRSAFELGLAPAESARLLHRVLRARAAGRGFLTLFLARLDPVTGTLDWVSAAHPSPIVRRADGRLEELAQGAPPLGVGEESRAESGTTTLAPGDLLLLFTDGLYEAVGAAGEPFGWERVRATFAASTTATTARERLLAGFDLHLAGEAPADDLTMVVVERAAG